MEIGGQVTYLVRHEDVLKILADHGFKPSENWLARLQERTPD